MRRAHELGVHSITTHHVDLALDVRESYRDMQLVEGESDQPDTGDQVDAAMNHESESCYEERESGK